MKKVFCLLWRNIECLSSHVNFLINIHAWQNEENSRTSCPTGQEQPKSKDNSSLIFLKVILQIFLILGLWETLAIQFDYSYTKFGNKQ